jgi:hypothetical protein
MIVGNHRPVYPRMRSSHGGSHIKTLCTGIYMRTLTWSSSHPRLEVAVVWTPTAVVVGILTAFKDSPPHTPYYQVKVL